MEIRFQTKDESNQQQEQEFLKLPKTERFYRFLSLSVRFLAFPSKTRTQEGSSNFIIEINRVK